MTEQMDRLDEALRRVRGETDLVPRVGLVLGSGLGGLAEGIEGKVVIPYKEIPNMPVSTVPGHSGQLVLGTLRGCAVAALQGRVHFYEGYRMDQVVFPARLLGRLGIRVLMVTNASGGINPLFEPGDLMVITDHINMMFRNPLLGPNEDGMGERFPDMNRVYDRELIKVVEEAALQCGVTLRHGVYLSLIGPSYETPAEIRMLRMLGADAVGMSTVPEVIAAHHMGLRVCGVSCITNMAAGMSPLPLTHEDVEAVAGRTRGRFTGLVEEVVARVGAWGDW